MAQEITVGGGFGFRLAPDLNYISNKVSTENTKYRIWTIDASQGFTTALLLEGKFYLSHLYFGSLTDGVDVSVRLTIDDVLIWDSTIGSAKSLQLLGQTSASYTYPEVIYCESSILLEISQAGGTDIYLDYLARPIL